VAIHRGISRVQHLKNPLDQDHVKRAYARWAPFYDMVLGFLCAPGRAAGSGAMEWVGGRILEVGVGTGLSLPGYSRSNTFVGIDISEPMLRKAKARASTSGLTHLGRLAVMDGTRLGFADNSFDAVAALFVITAVSDPDGILDELVRVVRPRGEIVLVAHFGAEAEPLRTLERWFAVLTYRLGWRPDFPYRRVLDWSARSGLSLLERRQIAPLGFFSLLRYEKVSA
jgi:phosphatidylethanolamine/phosphatidyl-N-methylethanolamine N-methyltransferase